MIAEGVMREAVQYFLCWILSWSNRQNITADGGRIWENANKAKMQKVRGHKIPSYRKYFLKSACQAITSLLC